MVPCYGVNYAEINLLISKGQNNEVHFVFNGVPVQWVGYGDIGLLTSEFSVMKHGLWQQFIFHKQTRKSCSHRTLSMNYLHQF